ncbi:hypothetical protein AB0E27_09460 [Streptomyces sparsogenes]|uniref:hypothetical protein n=1 Tax=Streptomyces sparsogenes TaxID=67365 RepID=UPI00340E310F
MACTYTNHAYANIKNNTGITLKRVTLHHQYSDDPDEGMSWENVAPGATTSDMEVNYNTGFIRTGQDYWWCQYTLPDGSIWVSPGRLLETLHPGDQGTSRTFTITGSLFAGRSDSMNLHKESLPNYNAWAVIALRNEFPVSLEAKLEHRYGSDSAQEHRWELPPGAESGAEQPFIVHYDTGFIEAGTDHWKITAQLDVPPYDNALETAFKTFTNAKDDKACMLEASDNGKTHTFTANGKGLELGIMSGPCSDQWRTWNGYNTLAFIEIKNSFATDISTVVLNHQYSSDAVWGQTRALVASGSVSSLMVAECNTGAFHPGLDYWNVYVYLSNGQWYQNHTMNKECMLSGADAAGRSTFTVSENTFTMGLQSGSCKDAMDKKGTFSSNAGRDSSRPYNKNAFIGSHNAYANFASGFWYAQQSGSLATQLAQGATTLLLDIWHDSGNIYLKHGDQGILQPFAANQKLSDALAVIRDYLAMQSQNSAWDPVTIIFEDQVEPQHQSLIKKAFVDSRTWDLTFNPATYGVAEKGWPTLSDFFAMRQPLIVLTSNPNSSDFAYQWHYMSENVYGDQSLDTATWLNSRRESPDLSQHALCALNHFPSWSFSSFNLGNWINRASKDNDTGLLERMVDACFLRWSRYANYINADFWEVPEHGLIEAVKKMNERLHKTTQPVIRMQHGRAILEEIDHSRLLYGNWVRATRWIDQHFARICPCPDSNEPVPITHQLMDAVNLALVVSVIQSSVPPGDTLVRDWTQRISSKLISYLQTIEPMVIESIERGAFTAVDELFAIPYFLMERASDLRFTITDIVRRRTRHSGYFGDHDRILLAGLAGDPSTTTRLTERIAAARTQPSDGNATSRMYDLTHAILYRSLLEPDTYCEGDLEGRLSELLDQVTPGNRDLGSELLACYWLTGGSVNDSSRAAVEQLKAHSEGLPFDCEPDSDTCYCRRFKEEVHDRLTMAMGLGVTLGMKGEILDQGGARREH